MPEKTTSADTPTLKKCPSAWTPHRRSCYWVGEEVSSWLGARISCQSLSHPAPRLATILSSEENEFVSSLPDGGGMVWVGAARMHGAKNGAWAWDDQGVR